MTARISGMARQRNLDGDARATIGSRRDIETVALGVKQFESMTHVRKANAGLEIALQSDAVVLDRADERITLRADAHVDAPAPGRESVRECVFHQRLQHQPWNACVARRRIERNAGLDLAAETLAHQFEVAF